VAGRLVVVVLASVLAVGCGANGTTEKPSPKPEVTLVGIGSGEMIDIGRRHLYMECVGTGSPTVVLEAGQGGTSRNWTAVLPELGRTTRTCAYDRAGLGDSDALPRGGVRDADDEIADLERLLDRARIKPPYVLAGHSYGGLLARLFAHKHPDTTGGVVLVDAAGRDMWRRVFGAWPTSLAPKLRRALAEPVVAGVDYGESEALAGRVRSLGDTPLVVISAARGRELFRLLPPSLYPRLKRLWAVMQNELAGLSSDHAHVVALRSDHVVQRADEQPQVVVRAVRAVVTAVRGNGELPPCERTFSGPDVRCLS
jgi:pimeloyl-ACP methyl ester carboxylesterase